MPTESFESALAQLEEVTTRLESPGLTLEEALQLFEKGIQKVRFCEKKLKEAQGKIEKLLVENGEFKTEPFV